MKKNFLLCLASLMLVLVVFSAGIAADAPKVVTLGVLQDSVPNSYVDEKGNPTGHNVEIAMLIDELLPQYEFKYDVSDEESSLISAETGKYAVSIGNYMWNQKRADIYLFTENPISASVDGFIVKKENAEGIDSFAGFAKKGLSLVPKTASDFNYQLILKYNQENPKNEIKIETVGEKIAVGEAMQMVLEGRYGAALFLKNNYKAVKEKVDPKDQLTFVGFTTVKTYVLFNKNEAELVKAWDEAMVKLKEDGTLKDLSIKYYGEDIYAYDK